MLVWTRIWLQLVVRNLALLARWCLDQSILHTLSAGHFTFSEDHARLARNYNVHRLLVRGVVLTWADCCPDFRRLRCVCMLQAISRDPKRRLVVGSEARKELVKSNLQMANLYRTLHVAKPLHEALTRVNAGPPLLS